MIMASGRRDTEWDKTSHDCHSQAVERVTISQMLSDYIIARCDHRRFVCFSFVTQHFNTVSHSRIPNSIVCASTWARTVLPVVFAFIANFSLLFSFIKQLFFSQLDCIVVLGSWWLIALDCLAQIKIHNFFFVRLFLFLFWTIYFRFWVSLSLSLYLSI